MKAFPKTREYNVSDGSEGMDLRDYFAAKAMGMISYPDKLSEYNTEHFKKYMKMACACCYQIADAMMKARENDS